MNTRIYLLALATAFAFTSCSRDDNAEPNIPLEEPVETNSPNTTYSPAFEGQTRIDGTKTTTPYTASILTSSLSAPWGIASLPDGRLLITEKSGKLRLATNTGTLSAPITGLPAVNASGQGGMLGLCIDPQFGTNRMIYWAFSEPVTGGTWTAVAKGRLNNNETAVENIVVIYRANPASTSTAHYGGRVIFDKTGNLLVSIGEKSSGDTRALAQSVTASLGKIVRITTEGLPAPSNPTFPQANALPELFSIGHRNPQGIAIHPVTGELWQSEHGPRGGDEINRVIGGKNYGWPLITYGIEYSGQPVGSGIQQQSGMEQPVYYWDPVISPSGITFYAGNRIPEWENNLFIGALSGTHIARLVIRDNVVVAEERLLQDENQRFRAITQGSDNALYAITDAGRLYKIDRQ